MALALFSSCDVFATSTSSIDTDMRAVQNRITGDVKYRNTVTLDEMFDVPDGLDTIGQCTSLVRCAKLCVIATPSSGHPILVLAAAHVSLI